MDEQAVRAALKRYMYYSGIDADIAHDIFHDDAVLEFPQSGERFDGVENFREWRRIYPAKVDFEIQRIRGRDDFWVMELVFRYDDGPWRYGVSLLEFRGDKLAREVIYSMDAWEAPEWRSQWRAAPPPETRDEAASGPATDTAGA